MKLFNFKNLFAKKRNSDQKLSPSIGDSLLSAFLEPNRVSAQKAMNIPAVSQCVNLISETISMIPVKLYTEKFEENHRKTAEVNDKRAELLNLDTRDTLDGVQFKRAITRDYLLNGAGFAYINKIGNEVKSLNYVPFENVSFIKNSDMIFKDYNILVQAKKYNPFEFLKIIRFTKDGIQGSGILQESPELLSTAYTMLLYERNLVSAGGNKKGFITATSKLSKESMAELKKAWKNLYSNNEENVIILNEGLSFKEASNTSVEMQLNQKKKSMNEDIRGIFGILDNFKYETFIKTAITPILSEIECALNRDLLLESEKGSFYFAFDCKEITKGDIKARFESYKLALESNLMQIDECRYLENLEPLGLNFIKLGLQDVLYNPAAKEVFTPNTGQSVNISRDVKSVSAD
jgi:HK97 family phage portal protein